MFLSEEERSEPEQRVAAAMVRLLVTAEPKLWTQTMEMFKRLSGDVIEVGEMADSVKDGEEEGSAGHNLVEDDVGVQGDVLVEGPLLHLSDEVPADSQQEETVAERDRRS